jgi:hypothetical protein
VQRIPTPTQQTSTLQRSSQVESNYTQKFEAGEPSDRHIYDGGHASDDSDDEENWEERNIVDSISKIKRFIDLQKRAASKGEDLDDAVPEMAKDPIAQYLKETAVKQIKPARIAFKKNTKLNENEEENEDQVKVKASLALKSYYMNDKFASAFSRNL